MLAQEDIDLAEGSGVTIDSVSRILKPNDYERELDLDPDVARSASFLVRTFPDLDFREGGFVFSNLRRPGKVFSIGALLGRPYFNTSERKTDKYADVQRSVNFLLNKREFLKKKLGDSFVMDRYEKMVLALKGRSQLEGTDYQKHFDAAAKVVGVYEVTKGFRISISDDPLDILAKSTGQLWKSCEHVGGSYEAGIYSDIQQGNLICYIFDSSDVAGRIMIRNCETDGGDASLGIESYWYTKHGRIAKMAFDETSIPLRKILAKIESVIKSKGIPLDYTTCTTPYVYRGYSDRNSGSGVITYGSVKPSIREIFRDSELNRASSCPFCHVYDEWETDLMTDADDESINKELEEHSGKVYNSFYIGKNAGVYDSSEGRVFISSSYGQPSCPECKSARILVEYSFNEYDHKDKHGHDVVLHDCPSKVKAEVLSRKPDILAHFKPRVDEYKNLLRRLGSGGAESIVEHVIFNELDKERTNKILVRKGSQQIGMGIHVEYRWNDGDFSEDDEPYVMVSINDENIDFDGLVEKYVRKNFAGSIVDFLLEKGRKPVDACKYRTLDRFKPPKRYVRRA